MRAHNRKLQGIDEDEEEYSEGDEVDSWYEDEDDLKYANRNHAVGKADFTEEQLEAMLDEYNDDEIGELENVSLCGQPASTQLFLTSINSTIILDRRRRRRGIS